MIMIKRLTDVSLPTKAHPNDAGLDLRAPETITIKPGEARKIATGICLKIPKGYYGKIFDRSSNAIRKLMVVAGVIDAEFVGELSVILLNMNISDIIINKEDKFCQIVIMRVENLNLCETNELENTVRGDRCFGSSGV